MSNKIEKVFKFLLSQVFKFSELLNALKLMLTISVFIWLTKSFSFLFLLLLLFLNFIFSKFEM